MRVRNVSFRSKLLLSSFLASRIRIRILFRTRATSHEATQKFEVDFGQKQGGCLGSQRSSSLVPSLVQAVLIFVLVIITHFARLRSCNGVRIKSFKSAIFRLPWYSVVHRAKHLQKMVTMPFYHIGKICGRHCGRRACQKASIFVILIR
jgi:hypothetical protein